MKQISVIITIQFFSITAFTQTDKKADSLKWIKEIDEQVWKPFCKIIERTSGADMKDLHSKRFMRVFIDHGDIMGFDKYFAERNNNSQSRNDSITRTFELRFDKRIVNGTMAWETGYYKGASFKNGKEIRSYYGRFYVTLEKENAVWKVLLDADTREGANEESFKKATPMQ